MESPKLISKGNWQPVTFVERGVSVAFTTPSLALSRLRPAAGGQRELIVGNPSGGSGHYILPLRSAADFTKLTVHDRLLVDLLQRIPTITPSAVQRAVRRVALSGAAGRAAVATVNAAMEREAVAHLIARSNFVSVLCTNFGVASDNARPSDPDASNECDGIRQALLSLAPLLDRTADGLFQEITALSPLMAPIGDQAEGGVGSLIVKTDEFAQSVTEWGREEPPEYQCAAQLIGDCAEFTAVQATSILRQLQADIARSEDLLRRWLNNRSSVVHRLTRVDWFLDGWIEICALWEMSNSDQRPSRRRLLGRLETIVPAIPKEFSRWVETDKDPQQRLAQRRWIKLNEDWRSGGQVVHETARNETMRALVG